MKKVMPNVALLVAQLPDADRPGRESKFTGPPPDEAKRIAAAIVEGGEESIIELASMVRDAAGGGEENYKPGYALRCVALYVAGADLAGDRARFVTALSSAVRTGNLTDGAKGFLLRELEAAGGDDAVAVLAESLQSEVLRADAARALVAIGTDGARAALRAALAEATTPSARLTLLQALGALAERSAREAFRAGLADPDGDLRVVCAWALARTGDGSADGQALLAAAKARGWERIQLRKSALLFADNLAAAGSAAEADAIYAALREGDDPAEAYLRDAAGRKADKDD